MSAEGLEKARWAKARRDRNRQAGRCINDTVAPSHGPPVEGCAGRCSACHAVKKSTRTPSAIECPQCLAARTHPCRGLAGAGRPTRFHMARVEAAKAKAA